MIVNFTKNHQFHTRLQLNDKNIEIVKKMKILGTIFTDNFSWDENCAAIIKKVNARMQLQMESVLSKHTRTIMCSVG